MKKNMKTILLTLFVSMSAYAQDPVLDQIRLTQDAVRIALNEVENAPTGSIVSIDGDDKVAAFNEQNKLLLQKFEEQIRTQVLLPLQLLVQQYNNIVDNQSIGKEAKKTILENLLGQISATANDRKDAYAQIVQGVHKSMTNFSVVSSVVSRKICMKKANEVPFEGFEDGNGVVSFKFDPVMETGNGSFLVFSTKPTYYCSLEYLEYAFNRLAFKASVTRSLAKGCYTSSCFFQTLSAYTQWVTMINSVLARELSIKLNDGNTVKIVPSFKSVYVSNPDYPTRRVKEIVAQRVLSSVVIGDTIPKLLPDMSSERINLFQKIDSQIQVPSLRSSRSCSKTVAVLKRKICQTREGCMSAVEVSYLKDRVVGMSNQTERQKCLN